jgi:hypothetical protein
MLLSVIRIIPLHRGGDGHLQVVVVNPEVPLDHDPDDFGK